MRWMRVIGVGVGERDFGSSTLQVGTWSRGEIDGGQRQERPPPPEHTAFFPSLPELGCRRLGVGHLTRYLVGSRCTTVIEGGRRWRWAERARRDLDGMGRSNRVKGQKQGASGAVLCFGMEVARCFGRATGRNIFLISGDLPAPREMEVDGRPRTCICI